MPNKSGVTETDVTRDERISKQGRRLILVVAAVYILLLVSIAVEIMTEKPTHAAPANIVGTSQHEGIK